MKKSILWLASIGIVLGIAVVGIKSYCIAPERISSSQFQQIYEEVTSLEISISNLTPDYTGSRLAYVHSTEQGRGLAVVDLKTLERTEVQVPNEVTQIGGWSPDGVHLAFVQTPPVRAGFQPGDLKDSWLTLYNTETRTALRLTEATNVAETWFFWLNQMRSTELGMRNNLNAERGVRNEESFLFVTKPVTNPLAAAELYMGSVDFGVRDGESDSALPIPNSAFKKVANYMPEFLIESSNRAAYGYKGNLYELEIKPLPRSEKWGWDDNAKVVRQLTKWSTNDFDVIKWLRYAPATGNFLFCARPTNSTWRYLFEYDPRGGDGSSPQPASSAQTTEDTVPQSGKLTQLSQEDTYNGQYLQGGRGFAYVGNPNNSFYLAVRPENPADHTNLFTHGSVVSYAASPSGLKLYTHGAIGDEPQGIWEYDLQSRQLRQVANGMNKPFVASRVISPEEIKVKSFDDMEIPCFFFTPSAAADAPKTNQTGFFNTLKPRVKYPAVIYIPPNSAQMQRSFGPRSQFLANIGFYFLAVNYRGVDGYGRDYASKYDGSDSAQDILAAYEWLVKNPNIDKENIFIFSMSGGTPICMELLAIAPKLWRGMAIDKPSGCRIDERFEPEKFPALYFITGDQDEAKSSTEKFSSWAKENKVDFQMTIYTNAAHITFDLKSRKLSQKQVAEFYLEKLKN